MKEKVYTIIFMFLMIGGFILNVVIPKKDISVFERRTLAKFPKMTIKGLLNGKDMSNFDTYVTDHFILRDTFRSVKAKTEILLGKSDVNGLFYKDSHYFKNETVYNERQVNGFVKKINYIYDNYFINNDVYLSIIPDKKYYLDSSKYLSFDYDKLFSKMDDLNTGIRYIDITDNIELDSYYYTDHHLRQDKLNSAISDLGLKMGFYIPNDYTIDEYKPFYGAYFGQLPIKNTGESMFVLRNYTTDNSLVYNIENDFDKVYDFDKFGSVDSYDVFLSGATAYQEVINPGSCCGKELIIFRDSYGSSFVPLMLDGYKKITLIDLRYGNLEYLMDKVEINNQDILFLYSTGLVNGSDVLKVY